MPVWAMKKNNVYEHGTEKKFLKKKQEKKTQRKKQTNKKFFKEKWPGPFFLIILNYNSIWQQKMEGKNEQILN